MKKLLVILVVLITTGCTSVKYNGTDTYVKHVNYPEVGKVITQRSESLFLPSAKACIGSDKPPRTTPIAE